MGGRRARVGLLGGAKPHKWVASHSPRQRRLTGLSDTGIDPLRQALERRSL